MKYVIVVSIGNQIGFIGLDGELEDFEAVRNKVKNFKNFGTYGDIKVLEFEDFKLKKFGLLEPCITDVHLTYAEDSDWDKNE